MITIYWASSWVCYYDGLTIFEASVRTGMMVCLNYCYLAKKRCVGNLAQGGSKTNGSIPRLPYHEKSKDKGIDAL